MSIANSCSSYSASARKQRMIVPFGATVALVGAMALPATVRADANAGLPSAVGAFKEVRSATYTPATLENLIDGEAQAVKEYNFIKTAHGEYAPNGQGNQLITVDIYQFGAPEDAYGDYAGQRSRVAKLLKIGAEGYQEETALNFWKGPYYVRIAITAQHVTPQFQQEMQPLAKAVESRLTGSTAIPALVAALPPGYTPRTERYQRSNIAAQSYFQNGVSARYAIAGPQAELFLVSLPSASAAKSAFTRYQAFLTSPTNLGFNAKPAPVKGLGDSSVSVKTKFVGEVVAAAKGKYVVVVRKAKDEKSAETLARVALAHAR